MAWDCTSHRADPNGLGLANVAERLQTLYQDRAEHHARAARRRRQPRDRAHPARRGAEPMRSLIVDDEESGARAPARACSPRIREIEIVGEARDGLEAVAEDRRAAARPALPRYRNARADRLRSSALPAAATCPCRW